MLSRDSSDRFGQLGFGVVAAAIACCAGLPLLAGAAAGIGIGAVIGIGVGGIVAIVAVAGALAVVRARRR